MGDKFAGLRLIQAKASLDDALQARALLVVELAVDGGEMDQQGGGGELIVGGLERVSRGAPRARSPRKVLRELNIGAAFGVCEFAVL